MPERYLAAIEVDQRQRVITSADKLKEMLGGSWDIERTVEIAKEAVRQIGGKTPATSVVMPVSGAVWLASTDLEQLGEILWFCRVQIIEELNLPCTFAIIRRSEPPDVGQDRKALNARVRELKNSKTGEQGLPGLPFLASCRIQPQYPANHWTPKKEKNPQTFRRALMSRSSERRLISGVRTLERYKRRFHSRTGYAWPHDLGDLTRGDSDSYLALIKADGDGMSSLVEAMNWTADEEARTFSEAVDRCIWKAVELTIDAKFWRGRVGVFPVVPIVRAGEDSVLIARRDLALEIAIRIGLNYESIISENTMLRKVSARHPLSLSFGIIFAKQGFPIEIMWDMAEGLQRSSKNGRAKAKGTAEGSTGWLDMYWMASSARIDVLDQRREAFDVYDSANHQTFRLTTRPWSLRQADKMLKAAQHVQSIPPGKWVLLDTILRLGKKLSEHAYRSWLQHLTSGQRKQLFEVFREIPELAGAKPWESPWRERAPIWDTPLLDWVEILKTTGRIEGA